MNERQAIHDAATLLRHQAKLRFDEHGPHDVRGAALWDAGCLIDPDDGDALGIGREAVDRELQARRGLLSTEEAMSTHHDDGEFHRNVLLLSHYAPALIDVMLNEATQRRATHTRMRRILAEGPLATGGIIPEGSVARHIEDDDGRP